MALCLGKSANNVPNEVISLPATNRDRHTHPPMLALDDFKQGIFMPDTIELLNTIGRNAMRCHASADQLAFILEEAKASEALTSPVAAGDSSLLFKAFVHNANHAPQISNTPAHEEDEPDQDDDNGWDAL